jgi:hypothetical protein
MTDSRPTDQKSGVRADIRLRAILSSWHQSRGFRSVAATHYRRRAVRNASQTDLNREFKKQRHADWRWFLISLGLHNYSLSLFAALGLKAKGK